MQSAQEKKRYDASMKAYVLSMMVLFALPRGVIGRLCPWIVVLPGHLIYILSVTL